MPYIIKNFGFKFNKHNTIRILLELKCVIVIHIWARLDQVSITHNYIPLGAVGLRSSRMNRWLKQGDRWCPANRDAERINGSFKRKISKSSEILL